MILTTKQKLSIPLKISSLQTWFVKQSRNRLIFYQTKKFWISVEGRGLLTLPLAKQAKSVTLVDISEKMLEQARLKAEQQDIKNIQFFGARFTGKTLEARVLISLLFVGFFIICLMWMWLSHCFINI